MRYVADLRDQRHRSKSAAYNAHTVNFENIYGENQDERTQNVWQTADAFTMEQLENGDAKIFHLGPLLADDISAPLIKTLAAKGKISLDAQGYLRKVVNNKVYPVDWAEKQDALQYISILKADEAEMQALNRIYKNVSDGAKCLVEAGA